MTQVMSKYSDFDIRVIDKVKKLIESSNVIPFYQEIVCNNESKKKKYECLARLYDGEQYISPLYFIDYAKAANVTHLITMQMISKSFEFFKNKSRISFSINISFSDITNPDIRSYTLEAIDHFPYPKNITFEILEDESIDFIYQEAHEIMNCKKKPCAEFIDTLRAKGCKIALDDFGSGYSNFLNLTKLDLDIIKIDGSIIKNIEKENVYVLVETITKLAKAYGLKTVAEFVENEIIYNHVKKLGIDYSQGYYFGKPCVSI